MSAPGTSINIDSNANILTPSAGTGLGATDKIVAACLKLNSDVTFWPTSVAVAVKTGLAGSQAGTAQLTVKLTALESCPSMPAPG